MRKTIRQKCFETNSSSMHSICVTKNDVHVTEQEINTQTEHYDNDEYIYIKDGEWYIFNFEIEDGFGRYPFQVLSTFKDKFIYAMCAFMGDLYPSDPEWEEYKELFQQIAYEVAGVTYIKISEEEFDIYLDKEGNEIPHSKLIYDHYDNGKREIVYHYKDSDGVEHKATLSDEVWIDWKIGSIDHQSRFLLKNFLKKKNISLKEFLSNKKYKIIVDGDEYCAWDGLKHTGLINLSQIVEEYPHGDDNFPDPEWEEYKAEELKNENNETL